MIVVLAAEADEAAVALVDRWRHRGAARLTARDLSRRGWRIIMGRTEAGTAVIDGAAVPVRDITAVLTLAPSVSVLDLPWVVRRDRDYVAQEMTAFLLAWLSELKCPVVNRPTPTGLWGPRIPDEKWQGLARQAALRQSSQRDRAAVSVTVVGARAAGPVADDLGAQATGLARAAGVDLLTVVFDGPEADSGFVQAHYRPELNDPEVADALLSLLAEDRV